MTTTNHLTPSPLPTKDAPKCRGSRGGGGSFNEPAIEKIIRLIVADGDASPRTIKSYTQAIRLYFEWCFSIGAIPEKANEEHILMYRAQLIEQYKPGTVKLYLRGVRLFYDALKRAGRRLYGHVGCRNRRTDRGARPPHAWEVDAARGGACGSSRRDRNAPSAVWHSGSALLRLRWHQLHRDASVSACRSFVDSRSGFHLVGAGATSPAHLPGQVARGCVCGNGTYQSRRVMYENNED